MKKQLLSIGAVAAVAFSLALAAPRSASAQLDPGYKSFGVYEDGVLVGEILRVETDPTHYAEHWVLYPDYIYPSEKNGISIEIRPGLAEYRGTTDFFARVPWSEGSRYVRTDCLDGEKLPTH